MDLKWWARRNDWRVFVASSAHRLRPGGRARELVRFIPAHSDIPPEQKPDQRLAVLFELPLGKGTLWVCDLDILESVEADPAARLFARNLAPPQATEKIPSCALSSGNSSSRPPNGRPSRGPRSR